MDFETWLTEQGFVLAELNDAQTTSLQAMFDASQAPVEPPVAVATEDPPAQPPAADTAVADLRAEFAADLKRISAIQGICGVEHGAIAAQAIEEGWDTVRTELEVLRASRPSAPAVHQGRPAMSDRVLEAATCMSAGLTGDSLLKEFGEQAIEAAYAMRHIGLRELAAECARLEGHDIPRVFGDGTATIRAGFSTISLPGASMVLGVPDVIDFENFLKRDEDSAAGRFMGSLKGQLDRETGIVKVTITLGDGKTIDAEHQVALEPEEEE